MATRWRGLLAPINQPTGDGRRMAPGAFTHRPLPLPLKWQRTDEAGHDTSVVVGLMDTLDIDEANGQVWGGGELFDDVNPATTPRLAEDVAEAKLLVEKKVLGPSVDPGSAQAVTVLEGSNTPLDEANFERMFWESGGKPPPTELLFTNYEIAAATLVPVPAFAECRPFELTAGGLTAAEVRSSGWSDMPIAPREHPWDGAAAAQRLADDCGLDGDSPDWDCYASGFLYRYVDADPETKGAYGFGIVDHIDGQHQIVPRGVFAVASVLQGGRGGTKIPAEAQMKMRAVVGSIYMRMMEQFDDPSMVAPWDMDKMAIVAAAEMPPLDATLFDDPQLAGITPLTQRDLGNGWVHVFGHIATHDVCLVGVHDICTTAPYSDQEYVPFHRYSSTPDGMEMPLPVGRLTAAHGGLTNSCSCCLGNDDHACSSLSFGGAVAHHDQMQVLAYVRAGEDELNNAIWISGVRAPGLDRAGQALLRRQKVSGDWRYTAGSMELVEVLALARREPGFPLPRVAMGQGHQLALTAASVIRVDHVARQSVDLPAGPDLGALDYGRLGIEVARALATLAQPPSLTASVRTAGWSDMPLADDGRAWDAGAARRRLDGWAGDDISGKYARAFLWHDGDPGLKGSYKIPIADVIDGTLTIVPNAVRNASSRLPQSDIPADDQKRIRTVLDALFDRIHKQAGTAAVTAAQTHTGAMMALRMTEQDAARLCVTDGLPMDEMHLTLAYLGDADQIPPEVREKIEAKCRKVAAKQPGPLMGDGFALSAFNPGTVNKQPTTIVVGVGGEGLQDFRNAVMKGIGSHDGWQMPPNHTPWVPHVSLQETDDLSRIGALADRVGPVTFDRLRLAFGGEVIDIPLEKIVEQGEAMEPDTYATRATALTSQIELTVGMARAQRAAELTTQIQGTRAAVALATLGELAFNPRQTRDRNGRWTRGGGGSRGNKGGGGGADGEGGASGTDRSAAAGAEPLYTSQAEIGAVQGALRARNTKASKKAADALNETMLTPAEQDLLLEETAKLGAPTPIAWREQPGLNSGLRKIELQIGLAQRERKGTADTRISEGGGAGAGGADEGEGEDELLPDWEINEGV